MLFDISGFEWPQDQFSLPDYKKRSPYGILLFLFAFLIIMNSSDQKLFSIKKYKKNIIWTLAMFLEYWIFRHAKSFLMRLILSN